MPRRGRPPPRPRGPSSPSPAETTRPPPATRARTALSWSNRPCRSSKGRPGQSSPLAGGPEHDRDRCDGRRYPASWLQFARLRVDLELDDGVALLVADIEPLPARVDGEV